MYQARPQFNAKNRLKKGDHGTTRQGRTRFNAGEIDQGVVLVRGAGDGEEAACLAERPLKKPRHHQGVGLGSLADAGNQKQTDGNWLRQAP